MNIANLRLAAQHLTESRFRTPGDLLSHMGAMQAQDYAMSKWALGCRLPGSTEKEIEAALDTGEILRTHVLRPTWHLVMPADIRWMLALTAPRIKSSMKGRNRELGLDADVLAKSRRCLEKALGRGRHLTRDELRTELETVKIPTDDNRLSHLLAEAELDAVICSGSGGEKKHTYALLDERAPNAKTLPRDEALAELARRYFRSHGPATLADFIWWSGLGIKDAKQAWEATKPLFTEETAGENVYRFDPGLSAPARTQTYLLPAFDEFLIAYKDRSASMPVEHKGKAISVNGIFWPILVENGRVKGLWKRSFKGGHLNVETDFFETEEVTGAKKWESAIGKLAAFYGKKAV